MKRLLLITLPVLMAFCQCKTIPDKAFIMTVNGPVPATKMGISLIHEHILVDFIGADSINNGRWKRSKVIEQCITFS